MRWRPVVGVCMLAIVVVTLAKGQEAKDDDQQPESSIARAQWQDVQHPDHESSKGHSEKEEDKDDQFEQRRVRVRTGPKRRRRLRKRLRTTIPPTTGGEETTKEDVAVERQYPIRQRWSQEESVDYPRPEEDFRPFRRRPGKRRRRPLRKQYAEPTETQEIQENEELYRRRRKGYRKRIMIQDESTEETTPQEDQVQRKQEHNREAEESIKSRAPPEQIQSNFTVKGEIVRTRSNETQVHQHELKYLIKSNRQPERHTDKGVQTPDFDTVGEKKDNRGEITHQTSDINHSKEKIFDRKSLFSTSRRLPQTSAIIRRRLRPKNSTSDLILELKEKLLPQGYNQQMPEIIPPYKLIEEMMSTINTKIEKDSSEEPNYPKTQEPKTRQRETTTRANMNPDPDDHNMYTTIEEIYKVGKEPQTTTAVNEVVSDNNDDSLENINITNVEDHILDLLLTKNSSSRLAKILELRNMTLIQLIQHRERGSSQLHFSEVFSKHNETATEKPIVKDNHKEDNKLTEDSNNDASFNVESDPQKEIREPRIFESLPEFNKNTLSESRTQPYPTWSVIPNPDLTPVYIKNKYDEVPVITRPTIRPIYTDNIEEIILIEDNSVDQFPGNFNTNFANRISEGIRTFKRFPPGVKSAIIVSLGILVLAIIGFLSVLISCRVRQKRSRLRAKRDVLNEQLHNEEFMNSQRSLSPVLSKSQPSQPSFTQGIHSNTSSNRHYYLWRTLRKTFQYD